MKEPRPELHKDTIRFEQIKGIFNETQTNSAIHLFMNEALKN